MPGVTADLDQVELVNRARAGDADAYARLVHPHEQVAFRLAYLITRSAAEAEDAAQEGMVKAYVALRRFDPARPFRPWLLRIVANEARNRRRAAGRRAFHEWRAGMGRPDVLAPSPEGEVERADAVRRVLAAVERLGERDRLVIAARYLLDLSERETAAALGLPVGTVKSRTSRALDRLRQMLEDDRDG